MQLNQRLFKSIILTLVFLSSASYAGTLTYKSTIAFTNLNISKDHNGYYEQKDGSQVSGEFDLDYHQKKVNLAVTAITGKKAQFFGSNSKDLQLTRANVNINLTPHLSFAGGIFSTFYGSMNYSSNLRPEQTPLFFTISGYGEVIPVSNNAIKLSYHHSDKKNSWALSAGITSKINLYKYTSQSSSSPTFNVMYQHRFANSKLLFNSNYMKNVQGVSEGPNDNLLNGSYFENTLLFTTHRLSLGLDLHNDILTENTKLNLQTILGSYQLNDHFQLIGRYIKSRILSGHTFKAKTWLTGLQYHQHQLIGDIEAGQTNSNAQGKSKAVTFGLAYQFS
jgi:hypothetical protein